MRLGDENRRPCEETRARCRHHRSTSSVACIPLEGGGADTSAATACCVHSKVRLAVTLLHCIYRLPDGFKRALVGERPRRRSQA